MATIDSASEVSWRAGLRGARANLVPGLVLQAVALVLVLAYYQHPPTHEALARLARFHDRAGWPFGVVSTGLFGGLIPLLYLKSRSATRARFTWAGSAVILAFWSYKGIEVDIWYRLQARMIGASNDLTTVAIKVLLDQFVYCPVLAVPTTVIIYEWVEANFATDYVAADIRAGGWYRRKVVPVMISNLGVWVPAVCLIYALPTPLQLPLQNLVLCFWTLMLAHLMPARR